MPVLRSWCIITIQMIYWLIHIPLIGLLAFFFFKRFQTNISATIYLLAFSLKLFAGLCLGWIFYHYYGHGDTIAFFEKSKTIASLPPHDYFSTIFSSSNYTTASHPRILFFIKFLSFFTMITGNSYWLASMYLSLISFFSSWYFVVCLIKLFPPLKKVALVCFLFIPSIVFWSSGILKDTIAFSSLLFAIGTIIKVYHQKSVSVIEWILSIVAIFILFKLKHYLLITLLVFTGLLFFVRLIRKARPIYKIAALLAFIIAIATTQLIHPYLKFDRIGLTLYENNQAILNKSDPEDRLNISIDSPSIGSIVTVIPAALQTGLFRPSLFDRSPIWGWIHRIENTLLSILFVASIILYFKYRPEIDFPLILAALLAIVLLATMLTLSTPNFGSLVRYKNAFLPFFFLISSILPYRYLLQISPSNS